MRYTDIVRGGAPPPEPQKRAVPFAQVGGVTPEPAAGASLSFSERHAGFLTGVAESVRAAVRDGGAIPLDAVRRAVAAFVRDLPQAAGNVTVLVSHGPVEYFVRNMALNAVCSIQIGKAIGFSAEKLVELGIAALLHDVGALRIPPGILLAERPLSQDEMEVVRRHPQAGHDILKPFDREYPWLPLVPLQEHEREHGLGYPNRLQVSEIHEYARIVGIADVYEALVNPRPYRPARLPDRALREIIGLQEKKGYPKDLIRVLLQEFTLFPPGSWVRLSSGETARVRQIHPLAPFSPGVEIASGDRKGQAIDLSHDPLLHVQEAIPAPA